MTPEKEMERFWKGFPRGQRMYMETDPGYKQAIEARNFTRAQELASAVFCEQPSRRDLESAAQLMAAGPDALAESLAKLGVALASPDAHGNLVPRKIVLDGDKA